MGDVTDVYNLTLADVGMALLKVLCTRPKVLYALIRRHDEYSS